MRKKTLWLLQNDGNARFCEAPRSHKNTALQKNVEKPTIFRIRSVSNRFMILKKLAFWSFFSKTRPIYRKLKQTENGGYIMKIIRSIPRKAASVLTALAVALTLAAGAGITAATPAYAATTININVASDWATFAAAPYNSTLNNGDVLNIAAAAGSPTSATTINIARDANVTINGPSGYSPPTFSNLCIKESVADSKNHTVTISNLKLTAPAGQDGYDQYWGTLSISGANQLSGTGAGKNGISSLGASGAITILSNSYSTLTATGTASGISAATLFVQGNADVTAYSDTTDGTTNSITMNGAIPLINVASDAKLNTGGSGTKIGICTSATGGTLSIACDGSINATGSRGIYALSKGLSIGGSGTLIAQVAPGTGTNLPGVNANALSISGTNVTINGGSGTAYGLVLTGTTDINLTDGASLSVKGYGANALQFSNSGYGLLMQPGTSVTLNDNYTVAMTYPFKMASGSPSGCQWVTSGTAVQFAGGGTATSNPLQITFPSGTKQSTVKLAAPVCSIGSALYVSLASALAKVANGETIKMLADITQSAYTSFNNGKTFTFDTNGHVLDFKGNILGVFDNTTVTFKGCAGFKNLQGVDVYDLDLSGYTGTASFDSDLVLTGGGLYANDGAVVTVNGSITSDYYGIDAENGAKVTVSGSVTSDTIAAIRAYSMARVTVGSAAAPVKVASTGNDGVFAESSASVTVYGNVESGGDGCTGVYSNNAAAVNVYGNVKATGSGSWGVIAINNASVSVSGAVNSSGDGGVSADLGTATIDGAITVGAGATYIQLAGIGKSKGDGTQNAATGYTEYIDGTSKVLVKTPASPAAQAVIDQIGALPNPVATAADADKVAAAAAAYNALSAADKVLIPQAVKDRLAAAQAQAAALGKSASQAAPVTAIRSAQTTFYVVKGKSLTIPYAYDLAAGSTSTAQPVFTWTSDNNSSVSVTPAGKVKGLVAGKSAKVTVTADNGATKTFTVKVVKAALKATGVSVSKPPKTMAVGTFKILKVKISPAKATGAVVKFSLDKASKKYVSVDKAGKVTALAKGTAKITVKAGGQKTVVTIKVK